jgi:hypothetical protein
MFMQFMESVGGHTALRLCPQQVSLVTVNHHFSQVAIVECNLCTLRMASAHACICVEISKRTAEYWHWAN